jgi:hypothetical protein
MRSWLFISRVMEEYGTFLEIDSDKSMLLSALLPDRLKIPLFHVDYYALHNQLNAEYETQIISLT